MARGARAGVEREARLIDSGSLLPGISAEAFGLPDRTAVRFELPAAALRPFISDYHVLAADLGGRPPLEQTILPSWPVIRFALGGPRPTVRIGARVYDPVPAAALYGTSVQPARMVSHGGVGIGVSLTPLGWPRLFRHSAGRFRDQLVPLDQLFPAPLVSDLCARLDAARDGAAIKQLLDGFFRARIGPPPRDEAPLHDFTRYLEQEDSHDVAEAALRLGLTVAALRRLSVRYFGCPPKALMIRARFLRAFGRMLLDGGRPDYSTIPPSYFDLSHFLRDADRFLGTTPRRFVEADEGFLLGAMRARAAVLAAAVKRSA